MCLDLIFKINSLLMFLCFVDVLDMFVRMFGCFVDCCRFVGFVNGF
jgi:hypothetical protein